MNGHWIKAHFATAQGNLVTVFSLGRSSWTAMDANTFSTYRFADIPDQKERGKYLKMNKYNEHVKESIDYFNHELECRKHQVSDSSFQTTLQLAKEKMLTKQQ